MLRKEGINVGVVRPITVNPFPYGAFDKFDYRKIKGILDVEMSIPAQFIKDVEVAVKERVSIKTCLCSGGNIMSRDAVVSAIKDMSREGK